MCMDDLYRIEQTLNSLDTSDLSPDSFHNSCVMALGLSGQRNPLGSALLHLIHKPLQVNWMLARFLAASELEKQGVCTSKVSIDVATDALNWWYDDKCPRCEGRGVIDFEQTTCPECGGKRKKPAPSSKIVQDAVGVIDGALNWLENQQRARLKSW